MVFLLSSFYISDSDGYLVLAKDSNILCEMINFAENDKFVLTKVDQKLTISVFEPFYGFLEIIYGNRFSN
jgi:hypothetical protein